MGLDKVWRMFDRGSIAFNCGGNFAMFSQRISKVVMSICIVRLQFDSGCITFARGLWISAVPIGDPQIVMGHGKVWLQSCGPAIGHNSLVKHTGLAQHIS